MENIMSDENVESAIEDNLPMVNYIMLHRIYDILFLMAKQTVSSQELEKMIEYHKEGFLLGPSPAFRAKEEDE
jgi:hypothetical protein